MADLDICRYMALPGHNEYPYQNELIKKKHL